jgi:hypothetical protein
MSMEVELLEDRMDATAANGVGYGSCSTLVSTVSHFPKLRSELELLGSGRNADLIEDEVDALWTRVHMAPDSLASYIPYLVARGPPDGAEE